VIKIYSARDLTDAHLIKGMLESCGIPAHVNGGFLSGGIGELPPLDLVTVSVEDGQFEEAQRVLDEYERGEMMGD
jgi:hypothetical protein